MNRIAGWLIACFAIALKWSCRMTHHDDPRAGLYVDGKGIAIGFLHAHQLGGMFGIEGPHRVAMVSRSRDGDLIAAGVTAMGIELARGSARTRGRDKGGREALEALTQCARNGGTALVTVDGPRGPRNRVRRGIATLSKTVGVPIVVGIAVPNRRWILARTWDRMQVPKPFSRIDIHWATPIHPDGMTNEEIRQAASDALRALDLEHDPEEAAHFSV